LGTIAREPQLRADALPLGVEQHGIFHRWWKHAPLLEPDDKKKKPVGYARLRQPGYMEVAGARSIATHTDTLDTFANEAERPKQRATERAKPTKLCDGILQRDCGRAVERARLCGTGGQKRKRGINCILNRDLLVFC